MSDGSHRGFDHPNKNASGKPDFADDNGWGLGLYLIRAVVPYQADNQERDPAVLSDLRGNFPIQSHSTILPFAHEKTARRRLVAPGWLKPRTSDQGVL
jgi:hypothetical protein